MGFCGCTLQTSAIVAVVFGIIESAAGLITGIVFLQKYHLASTIIANVLLSATVFNGFWLLASIILVIGIVKENAVLHRVWVGTTSAIMVVDLVHTIVFIVGFVKLITSYYDSAYSYSRNSVYRSFDTDEIFLFALLMTAVSRGSVWLWIINICLTIYTAHRANEIERGPVPTAQTVIVYGNQPVHSFAMPGNTIIVQHGGPSTGMQPNYGYQQTQYGQPPTQYVGQSPVYTSAEEKGQREQHTGTGIPEKH